MKKSISPLSLINNSVKTLYKNPIIILPPLILTIFSLYLPKGYMKLADSIQSNTLQIIWLIVYTILNLSIISFFLSSLIGSSAEAIKSKSKFSSLINYPIKFWFKNLILIAIFLISFNIVQFVAIYGARWIGQLFSLSLNPATLTFFLIYILGLLSFIIFLSFSSFYLIIFNLSIKESLKKSISFVKTNYLLTLSIITSTFIVYQVLELISKYSNPILISIIDDLILVPLIAIIFAHVIISYSK